MSSKASFYSAAKRIETEKSVKHVGTASVRLDALDFPSAGLDRKNVERLKRLFQAGGCFPGQFANRIPALIHAEALQQALALSGVSAEQLRSGADVSDGHAPLEVPAGIRLHCLRGRHRAVAAGEMPTIRQKRWTVDLFLPDSSEDLRYALMDEYANEHCPDDGLFYFQIRLHQGVFGPRNRYFENRWWARLSAVSSSTNKKDRLRQLYRHKEFAPAFDAFRSMPALYYGLRLSVVNKMISMGCQEELLSFLEHIRDFWYNGVFCQDEREMLRLDPDTVQAVQLTAPGAHKGDWQALYDSVQSGAIFSAFQPSERLKLWENLCGASTRCLVPSLFAFFENLKYLKGPVECMKRLVSPTIKTSVYVALESAFSSASPGSSRCLVQSSPSTFFMAPAEPRDHFRLSYLQLWLYALREYRYMPPVAKKKLAMPDTGVANERVLYDFAALASKLGFATDAIEDLLQQNPDRAIARRLLLAARNPEQHEYPDLEQCITQIVDAVSTALPLELQESTQDDSTTDDCLVRAPGQLVNRCGIPRDGHQLNDRSSLYLTKMLSGAEVPAQPLTSLFVQRSMFFAFFTGRGFIQWDYLANREGETVLWNKEDYKPPPAAPSNTETLNEALKSSEQALLAVNANLQLLTSRQREHEEMCTQLEGTIVEKKTQLQDMESSEKTLQRRVQQLKGEETATEVSLRSLQHTKENLSRTVKQLQEERVHIIKEKEAQSQELQKLKALTREEEREKQERAHQAAEATKHQEVEQSTRIRELVLEREKQESQIQDLQSEEARGKDSVERLRAIEEGLQKDIHELQNEASRLRAVEQRLQEAIQELETEERRLRAGEKGLQEAIHELQQNKARCDVEKAEHNVWRQQRDASVAEWKEKSQSLDDSHQAKMNEATCAEKALQDRTKEQEALLKTAQYRTKEQEGVLNSIRSSVHKLTLDEVTLRSRMRQLAAAAGPVGEGRVCIVFREKDEVTDVLTVDTSRPDEVQRVAAKYARKHYGLFDKQNRTMTPADCFHKVTDDGSYTIILSHGHAVQAHRAGADTPGPSAKRAAANPDLENTARPASDSPSHT